MENKKSKEIHIDNIIALCHILDNFEQFNNNLSQFIIEYKGINFDIKSLSHFLTYRIGKNGITSKTYNYFDNTDEYYKKIASTFYEPNKEIINTINNFIPFNTWISQSYDSEGHLIEDSTLDACYKYLLNHKNDLNQIISLLSRMKELGNFFIIFNVNLDFTNAEYEIDPVFKNNRNIKYFDNIEIVPNSQSTAIKYKTTNSNYQIDLKTVTKKSKMEIPLDYLVISLNSLTFDPNRLPIALSKGDTFDKIVNLWKNNEDCTSIADSILDTQLKDLTTQFASIDKIIGEINSPDRKKEALEIMYRMRNDLERLRTINFDNNSNHKK